MTDAKGRPLRFVLTGGQAADCQTGKRLPAEAPAGALVHADKDYDTDRLRQMIEAGGGAPNIPPKANRIWKSCFSPYR